MEPTTNQTPAAPVLRVPALAIRDAQTIKEFADEFLVRAQEDEARARHERSAVHERVFGFR